MKHHHDYELIEDTERVQIEVCTECKKKLVTKKGKDGRINNREYLEEHSRDFAQPGGRTGKVYKRFYSRKNPV